MDDRWTISETGMSFSCQFDSREEAIEEGKAVYAKDFYIGKCQDVKAPSMPASYIFEHLNEALYDEVGDVVDDWPSVTRQDEEIFQKGLDKLIDEFLSKFGYRPEFFKVVEIELIKL